MHQPMPMHIPVTVTVTYQGEALSQSYLDTHPELQPLYPLAAFFMEVLYIPLLRKGMAEHPQQELLITEEGVWINGEKVTPDEQ